MPPKPKTRRFDSKKKADEPSKIALKDLSTLAATSKDRGVTSMVKFSEPPAENEQPSLFRRFLKYLYNREKKTFCSRTLKSWLCIVAYSIIYLIFLTTYFLIFIYGSLMIIKHLEVYLDVDKSELLTYADNGIGLSATPTAEDIFPLIWYKDGESDQYEKYVNSLDNLLKTDRRKRDVKKLTELGPCGSSPYGYGSSPCVVVRINKQLKWAGKPLTVESSKGKDVPAQVRKWLNLPKKKLWLHCSGYHAYDKEHIGNIKYYPDPPGFDPDLFPIDMQSRSPLVAVQFTNFTIGVSLAIECDLWYDGGPSRIQFVLYVAPDDRTQMRKHTNSSG